MRCTVRAVSFSPRDPGFEVFAQLATSIASGRMRAAIRLCADPTNKELGSRQRPFKATDYSR